MSTKLHSGWARRPNQPRRDLPKRAYVEALAVRYSGADNPDLKQLAIDYSKAMGELSRWFPDDLDAATLYAESLMNLRAWHLWSLDHEPAENTLEIVKVLESVLSRDPNHPGANHLYIHAVEASAHPEWALPSAQRLGSLTWGKSVTSPSAAMAFHRCATTRFRPKIARRQDRCISS